jgi:hypothetical protein
VWSQTVGGLLPFANLPAATPVAKPSLEQRGGQLIFSDCPEQLLETGSLPAAMYRDNVSGEFRVFYHHQNVTPAEIRIGAAVTNRSAEPEFLFARGSGVGINVYPDVAGQTALAKFLSSKSDVSFLALLLPGQTYWTTHTVRSGSTGSGIMQFLAISTPSSAARPALPVQLLEALNSSATDREGEPPQKLSLPPDFAAGAVTVTTLAYRGTRPADPLTLPILTSDGNTRGTFAHFDRVGGFTLPTAGGLGSLDIETSPPGQPYSDDMPGEYELGVDAVDGGIQVYDNGNYGVLYYFSITLLDSPASTPEPFALLMNPAGGSGHFVLMTDGHLAESGYVDYTSAWWFDQIYLHHPREVVHLLTSLTGGSDGPQVLLFYPGFTGN